MILSKSQCFESTYQINFKKHDKEKNGMGFFGTLEEGINIICHKGLMILSRSQCSESTIKLILKTWWEKKKIEMGLFGTSEEWINIIFHFYE